MGREAGLNCCPGGTLGKQHLALFVGVEVWPQAGTGKREADLGAQEGLTWASLPGDLRACADGVRLP